MHDYLLQPGDSLRLSMPGISGQTWDATIDMTGNIRFPFLDQHKAAGITLAELNTKMEVAATGLEVQVFDGAQKSTAVLSGDEIYLQVLRYRPVTVIGDISQPGTVDFVPGMTVRALLGQAGGAQIAELAGLRAPADSTVRLQSALQTQKWMQAQVLRSKILLEAPLDGVSVGKSEAEQLRGYLGDVEGKALVSEIEIALRERQYERVDLNERINLTKNRVESLERAYENYQQASISEEDRLQRALEMGDKGLVTADRVNEARNSALAASTRLLTVDSDVYEAKAELQRLQEELARVDDSFFSGVLDDKRRFSQQLSEVTAQVDSLRLLLADGGSQGQTPVTRTEILVHRGIGDQEVSTQMRPGDLVYPGDVVEVILRIPDSN
ncbi:polysaccharide biosynthesis/export family protein [Salipiger sp. PrR002]|uniref:polysaccharide biosynthesis/export family protein n=1 Tax=Salipiger sp. PrR002 TaxID=2706489 RepID=UPI0034CFDD82